MLSSTIVRYVATVCCGLAGFYLCVHALDAVGSIDKASVERVDWLFGKALEPVLTMDAAARRTAGVVAALVVVQLFALHAWFRKGAYRPDERTDPLAAAPRIAATGELPSRVARAEQTVVTVGEIAAAAEAPAVPDGAEYDRLLRLLGRQA